MESASARESSCVGTGVPRVVVRFRMACSGRELGIYSGPVRHMSDRRAPSAVELHISDVYDSIGLLLSKYDIVLDDQVYTSMDRYLYPLIVLPATDEETLYVSLVRKPLRYPSWGRRNWMAPVVQGVSSLLPESSIYCARVAWCHPGRPSL